MPPSAFELVIPESKRQQNHTLDIAANEIGKKSNNAGTNVSYDESRWRLTLAQ